MGVCNSSNKKEMSPKISPPSLKDKRVSSIVSSCKSVDSYEDLSIIPRSKYPNTPRPSASRFENIDFEFE